MQIYGSCAVREGAGVLLVGPPGSGKSDLLLRLLDRGFALVADDRIDIEDGIARAPALLRGLLEIRGLGIVRLPYVAEVRLALAVCLDSSGARLPEPARYPTLGLPQVSVDATRAAAPAIVALALDCALGRIEQVAGAFESGTAPTWTGAA